MNMHSEENLESIRQDERDRHRLVVQHGIGGIVAASQAHFGTGPTLATADGTPCDDGHDHLAHRYSNVGDPVGFVRYCPGKFPTREEFKAMCEPEDEPSMMWLRVGIPADQIPPHTQEILRGALSDAIALFVKKSVEYGETANHLGVKGQFADINRKYWKLKRLLWDENVPEWAISEDAEEVLMDFFGHAILTIHYLREEKKQHE